jgi:hypothetical protein
VALVAGVVVVVLIAVVGGCVDAVKVVLGVVKVVLGVGVVVGGIGVVVVVVGGGGVAVVVSVDRVDGVAVIVAMVFGVAVDVAVGEAVDVAVVATVVRAVVVVVAPAAVVVVVVAADVVEAAVCSGGWLVAGSEAVVGVSAVVDPVVLGMIKVEELALVASDEPTSDNPVVRWPSVVVAASVEVELASPVVEVVVNNRLVVVLIVSMLWLASAVVVKVEVAETEVETALAVMAVGALEVVESADRFALAVVGLVILNVKVAAFVALDVPAAVGDTLVKVENTVSVLKGVSSVSLVVSELSSSAEVVAFRGVVERVDVLSDVSKLVTVLLVS